MNNTVYLLAASMDLSAQEQSRIANNVANSNTTGFKEVLSSVSTKNDFEYNKNVKMPFPKLNLYNSNSQGSLTKTGDSLDIALNGKGYLVLEKGGKREYLRSGRLRVTEDGYLVNQNGFKLLGEDSRIEIDPGKAKKLKIDTGGELWIGKEKFGKLKLVNFENPEYLVSNKGSYHNTTGMLEQHAKYCKVYQGYLEESTVQIIDSTIEMITNKRYFEAIHKTIGILDQGWQKLMEI